MTPMVMLMVAFTVPGERWTVTAYTAGYESTGKRPGDVGYGITASGVRVRPGMCAAPASIPFGTRLRVGKLCVFTVTDRGGKIRKRHADLYVPSVKAAKAHGVKKLVVKVIGRKGSGR